MNLPGISFSEADGHVFLRCQPDAARPPLDMATVHALLAQHGYGECLLHDEAIATAVNDGNAQKAPFVTLVADRCDAKIEVQIAADEMAAEVSLTPPKGGKAAAMADLVRALAEAGVVFGIDEMVLVYACDLGHCEHLAVASGATPKDGVDTVFEALIPETVDRAPNLDADGLIDYRERGSIAVVEAGAPLMRRIPATPGVDGHTIRGRTLAARPGHDEPFANQLAGTELARDDANLLQAAVTGQPVRVTGGVVVEPILRLANVNMATGNVHFAGSVQVDGDVVQGMKVECSGDIVVKGMVDGGLLQAGGDIHVAGGVIAHARLHAGGAVSARFAQSAHIYAGTVIAIGDMAMDCELESLNQIKIGTEAPQRGRLIGGTTKAMMLIAVPLLGSSKAGVTKVVMGANPALEAQYAALQERIASEKATEENLAKLVAQLSAAGDPKGMLGRVKASRQHAVQVWGKSLVEKGELDKQLALARAARLEVGVGVAGAVDLSFGKISARLRREFNAGNFSVDIDSRVVYTDPAGKAVPAI